MSDELCPFCGGEGTPFELGRPINDTRHNEPGIKMMACDVCHFNVQREVWNIRVLSPAMVELLATVKAEGA